MGGQINRAFKSSIKMHLFHAQQSERKRRFSFSETDAGSAVQAALAQTYLHMMDPKNNELSKEIKNTREEVRPQAARQRERERVVREATGAMEVL